MANIVVATHDFLPPRRPGPARQSIPSALLEFESPTAALHVYDAPGRGTLPPIRRGLP